MAAPPRAVASASGLRAEAREVLPREVDELRGEVRVTNGESTIEMREGDALTIEFEPPSTLEPLRPVGPIDLPPRLIFVDCDSYRRIPHPVRMPLARR